MKEITQIENYRVEIWRRPFQRSMNLTVRPDGALRVTCGKRLSLREIRRFVGDSASFIQKRVLELEVLRQRCPQREFVSGELFLFFGARRPLEVIWTWEAKARVQVSDDCLIMKAPLQSTRMDRVQAMRRFYRRQARPHLDERMAHWTRAMQLTPARISVRGQTTRWGSCSGSGAISLNWKLAAAPPAVIDYVIIHELAHLVHLNHSPHFWRLVGEFHPAWRESKRWLREHEYEIGVLFRR